MSTNRSLNKLEFKAHMSIHNMVSVPDEETHESASYTRDRFQKKHRISETDGSPRVRRRGGKLPVVLAFLVLQFLWLPAPVSAGPRPNTDIRVESEELDEEDLNSRLGVHADEDRFGIPMNESTALGFNEDGDPSLSMRY